MDALRSDVRFAFRSLRATPIVPAVAVCSLPLGIGANAADFIPPPSSEPRDLSPEP